MFSIKKKNPITLTKINFNVNKILKTMYNYIC